jgi:hypothetical protein
MTITLEIATLTSAVLVFISACITIIVTARKDKKGTFITTVTNTRKDYIKELRDLVEEFCDLAANPTQAPTPSQTPSQPALEKLGCQLKLMMSPAQYPDWWDGVAVELIDKIITSKNAEDIKKFVILMQSWLALEWHGMMNESKRGILSNTKKNKLRSKFWQEYLEYIKK